MFKVKVSQQLKTYCEQQGQIYNLGQRYTANGNPEQQLTGDYRAKCRYGVIRRKMV